MWERKSVSEPTEQKRDWHVGGAYEKVFLGIAITVTAVWTVANLVQVILPNRPVPSYVNIVMMAVATSFFGGAVISSRRGKQ